MEKESARDYVTAIFRAWAAAGMPTYEEARDRIYNDELEKRSHMDAASAVAQAEAETEKRSSFLMDIMSAEKTIELLERGGKDMIVRAVKEIYCAAPGEPLRYRDIAARARRFSVMCPADIATVYRWLKEARLLCAAVRGLSISDEEIKRYHIAL